MNAVLVGAIVGATYLAVVKSEGLEALFVGMGCVTSYAIGRMYER